MSPRLFGILQVLFALRGRRPTADRVAFLLALPEPEVVSGVRKLVSMRLLDNLTLNPTADGERMARQLRDGARFVHRAA